MLSSPVISVDYNVATAVRNALRVLADHNMLYVLARDEDGQCVGSLQFDDAVYEDDAVGFCIRVTALADSSIRLMKRYYNSQTQKWEDEPVKQVLPQAGDSRS